MRKIGTVKCQRTSLLDMLDLVPAILGTTASTCLYNATLRSQSVYRTSQQRDRQQTQTQGTTKHLVHHYFYSQKIRKTLQHFCALILFSFLDSKYYVNLLQSERYCIVVIILESHPLIINTNIRETKNLQAEEGNKPYCHHQSELQ